MSSKKHLPLRKDVLPTTHPTPHRDGNSSKHRRCSLLSQKHINRPPSINRNRSRLSNLMKYLLLQKVGRRKKHRTPHKVENSLKHRHPQIIDHPWRHLHPRISGNSMKHRLSQKGDYPWKHPSPQKVANSSKHRRYLWLWQKHINHLPWRGPIQHRGENSMKHRPWQIIGHPTKHRTQRIIENSSTRHRQHRHLHRVKDPNQHKVLRLWMHHRS